MKYVPFCSGFEISPTCFANMFKALERIGEIDPFSIKKTTLYGIRKEKDILSKKDKINRGILTVRKALNRHLGKSGKYTNRMIRKTATIKSKEESTNDKTIYWLTTSLPKKDDAIKIVATTYNILWTFDHSCCCDLLNGEISDGYKPKIEIKNTVLKTLVPIQTNIVVRSKPETKDGEYIKTLFKNISK